MAATNQSSISVGADASVQTRRRGALRLLLADPLATVALTFLVLAAAAALLADFLVALDILTSPVAQDLLGRNKPPMFESRTGFTHILGTDQLGRDLLSRLVFGARISLGIGLLTIVVSGLVGVTLGLIAGYRGGRIDDAIMRLIDIQMGFPQMLLALIIIYAAGASVLNLVLVLTLTRWMVIARVTRASCLSLRESLFVEAARSLGAGHLRIVVLHILPNLAPTLMILISLEFGRVMLAEAGLSFIGMGIQPPDASWGLMLSQGRAYIGSAWWLVTFPGLAIALTTLTTNLLANWMRSVTDPSYRKRG